MKLENRRKQARLARQAILETLDLTAERLGGWLLSVADGIPKLTSDGKPVVDSAGSVVWLVKPDKGQAVKLYSELAEFALPKLSRAEVDVRSIHATLDNLSPFAQSLLSEPIEGESSSLADRLRSLARQDQVELLPDWLQQQSGLVQDAVIVEQSGAVDES